jgi:hypothetical protein
MGGRDDSNPQSVVSKPPFRMSLGILCAGLILYTSTLAPDLLWGGGDFAKFQLRAYILEIEAGVFGHPLWVVLAHPFTYLPIRNVAWRANFASAIFASVTLLVVFSIAWHLTHSARASLLGTAALAVSHTFWTYAVLPKVYSLNALMLSTCIYLLILWQEKKRGIYLYVFILLYSLSLFNHLVMATAAAGFAVFIAWELLSRRGQTSARRQFLTATVIGVLSLLPHVWFSRVFGSGADSSGAVLSFLRGGLTFLITPQYWLKGGGWGLSLLWYQFPLTIVLGFIGLFRMRSSQPRKWWLLLLVCAGDVAFLLGATDPRTGGDYVWNLHYYLQVYVISSLWISIGFEYAIAHFRQRRAKWLSFALAGATLIVPVVCYAVSPMVARVALRDLPGFRPLPGRDNYVFALSPWKFQETGARELGESMLAALPEGSVFFADYSLWSIVRYLQVVEGQRPDVSLVNLPLSGGGQVETIAEYAKDYHSLYLADVWRYYDIEGIEVYFDIVLTPPVYRLVPRQG